MKLKIKHLQGTDLIHLLIFLICLSVVLALAGLLLSEGVIRVLFGTLVVIVTLAIALFCFGIMPRVAQHDAAVNTLLAMDSHHEKPVSTEEIPPLNILIDEVMTVEREQYLVALSQNQNSLMVLQNQINPHFLYNTLDCIRGEALESGMDDIASMVEALSVFFRYSISSGDVLVQLRDELRNIQIYYQIQRYRFKDRFTMEIECEDEHALDCYLPKLTLQPIMENCILHGLEMKESGGRIVFHICLTDQRLIITVTDNGCGMNHNELTRLREKINSESGTQSERGMVRHGIAIQNINRQIKLIFGSSYGLSVSSQPNIGTEVELQIPAVNQKRGITLQGVWQ